MKPLKSIIILFLSILIIPISGQATPDTPLLVSQKGDYRIYRFIYSDENTTTIFPDRLGKKGGASTFMSALAFDGDLRVKDYGRVGNENIYSLSFDEVRASRFGLNGHPVFDSPAQFIGKYMKQEVYVCVDGNNEIIRFLFPPKTPQVFKTFMTTAAQEIQVSVRSGKKDWTTQEINQHGKGVVDYHVKGTKENHVELTKIRKNYDYPGLIAPGDKQNIRSKDNITLNRKGFIEEIDKHERTTITAPSNKKNILDVKKNLSLKMTAKGNFDPGAFEAKQLESMLTVYPGEPISDPGQNRELLAKQVNDLIYENMETWIKNFRPDTKDNRANNAMFYRSSGFVKLQPRSAGRLADFAREKGRTSGERTLVMNILAAAGTENAQTAMRNILSDPSVRKDPQYGVLIQNFSFMDVKPTAETIEFLSALMNGKKGYESYAAAHAFGACIHKLYKRSKKDKALALNNLIRKKIDGAINPDERAEYIAALGNAGMFENNKILTGYFKHPNPRVRAEAVMALRKTETADVRVQMLNLFKDMDRGVQRSCIQTYMQFSPDEKNIREMKNQLNAGKIQEANFYDLTSLLKKNMPQHPGLVKDCLKIMVRKKLKDPDLEARIRGML